MTPSGLHTHTLGTGRSFSLALELRLDVCDHEFQPKQPVWVPSGEIGREAPRCDHELWVQLQLEAEDGAEQEDSTSWVYSLHDLGE